MNQERDIHRVSFYNIVKDERNQDRLFIGKFTDETLWFLFMQENEERNKVAVTFDDWITLLKCVKSYLRGDASYTQYANFAENMCNDYVECVEDAIFHHKGFVSPFYVQRPYGVGQKCDTWVVVDYGDEIDFKKLEEEANCGYRRKWISTDEFWGNF